MTQASYQLDEAVRRFPLSAAQQLWHSGDRGDQAGFFNQRFITATALRISGQLDVAALQAALDDLVERHEILRTVVTGDAGTGCQQVHPPLPVPLQLWNLPPATDRSRGVIAEQLLNEAALSPLSPRQLPLLRAELSGFDDRDSVLTLLTHHSACDEWSMQVILRDLAACYAARASGHRPDLPDLLQYRECAQLQQAAASTPAADLARRYWRQQLRGARLFAVPTDHPVPDTHLEPYSAQNFVVDAEVIGSLTALAESLQTCTSTVLLAAFNVLAHQIAGTTDPAVGTLSTGRNDLRFENSVGPVTNLLVLRTDLAGCSSFRDVVARTRDSYHEACLHEIGIQHLEHDIPELLEPNEDTRMTSFVLGIHQPPFEDSALQIADSAYEIRRRVLPAPVASWIPRGVAWAMHLLPSGELTNCIRFNVEELDERTVADWASGYQRIVAAAAGDPDRDWKTL